MFGFDKINLQKLHSSLETNRGSMHVILSIFFTLFITVSGAAQYDYLTFVQDWPISDCIDWLEAIPSASKCSIKGNYR